MSYSISEQLISYNRSHQTLSPIGFVIHATDTPNATAQNEHDYFNSGNRQASAHYFTDWVSIIRTIPENEVAWHAGNTANHKYLSVEMCEPSNDSSKFQEVWNRTVWLVADACVRYGWNTNDNVFSHRGISAMYHQTDHIDPIEFLASYGRTWDQLLQAIDAKIVELKKPVPTIQSTIDNNQGVTKKVKNLVIYLYPEDEGSAMNLARHLQCPVSFYPKQFTSDLFDLVDNIYQIGGSAVNPKVKLISGTDFDDSTVAYLRLIGKI